MKILPLLALGSLLVSCGGGGGVSSTGSIPEAEACSQASIAVCGKIFSCKDANSGLVQAYLKDLTTCQATILQYCGSTGFMCSGGATYHGDQAQVCKDKFATQDCATLSAGIITGVVMMSTSAAIGSITAQIPACMMICSGGADAGGAG